MNYAELRQTVHEANLSLNATGLVMGTFGNLSAADHAQRIFAIKPSGVRYEDLSADKMVVVSLDDGRIVDGTLRPSSDTPTHFQLYRAFACGAIVHTHSEFATMFAQARLPIRCMGTTHADYFHGDIPVTRPMREDEVMSDYEKNTGLVIVEAFSAISPAAVPAVLVANHGPFAWGETAAKAIEHAQVLEYLARLEWRVRTVNPSAAPPDQFLIDKHYLRKHGPRAYYGQATETQATETHGNTRKT